MAGTVTTTATTEVRCRACHRKLTSARSREREYGDVCWALRQAAVREGYSPAQIARAIELLRDGGLVPQGEPGLWLAVPSGGGEPYLVTDSSCTCPAGWDDVRCYHRAALFIRSARLALRTAAFDLAA